MENLLIEIGLELGGMVVAAIASHAATRTRVGELSRRTHDLEKFVQDMPRNYVPRSEVELALRNIERTTGQTHSLVQAFVYAGGNRDAAVRAIEASAVLTPLEEYIANECPLFEGDEDHMYLDTAGKVTVGTGCMLPDADAAARLTMHVPSTGAVATVQELVAEFNRIKAMPFGAKYGAKFYRTQESLLMQPADRLALRRQRATLCLADLRKLFPGFDLFPHDEQLALLDMDFNLGPNRLAHEYTHFCAAIRARDPRLAASECRRNASDPAFAQRNLWTERMLLQANHGA